MTQIVGGYKGYWNFESYWQSGKVYPGISEEITKKWWKEQTSPKRKYPHTTKSPLYAKWPGLTWNGKAEIDYIPSRKLVYVPEYFNIMSGTESAKELKKYVEAGNDVILYDYDGPIAADGSFTTIEITLDNLKKEIEDRRYPFGHGYVVGAWLANIMPSEYTGIAASSKPPKATPAKKFKLDLKPASARGK
jgi:hypothetical protein